MDSSEADSASPYSNCQVIHSTMEVLMYSATKYKNQGLPKIAVMEMTHQINASVAPVSLQAFGYCP